MKKLLLLSLMVIGSHICSADVVSLQSNFVNGEANVVSHLNNDRTALTNGVNNVQGCATGGIQSAGQVKSATICAENMAPDADPRTRTLQGASCEFVYTGLTTATTSGTLVGSISAGTAYPQGWYVNKAGSTAKTFTALKWTYVDIDKNGSFTYTEQTIGGTAPSVAANSIRLERVSTDSTQILAVQDLRKLSCSNGPFSAIHDLQGEGSLGDIFSFGNAWQNGLSPTSISSTAITINTGTININGKYRTVGTAQSAPINQIANTPQGQSGIDSGVVTAYTNYYVYAAGDVDATASIQTVYSTNASAPLGVTNYRRIAEVSADGAASLVSSDPVGITYLGKVVQSKKVQTGAVATGTTAVNADDTPMLNTEGDQFMTMTFNPIDANDLLVFDFLGHFGNSTNFARIVAGVFQDSNPNSICLGAGNMANSPEMEQVSIHCEVPARIANTTTRFNLRAGSTTGTTTFNGESGGRLYAGGIDSIFKVTEKRR